MTIEEILTAKEGENFEFKTAENRFSYTELQKYASAISNEGGGKIVFGITDKRPRKVIGSKAFDQPERTRKGLIDSLRINVDFEVFNDGAEKRVLVFIIPARPIGLPVQVDGVAWWRDGDLQTSDGSGMGLSSLYGVWEKDKFAEPSIIKSYEPDRTKVMVEFEVDDSELREKTPEVKEKTPKLKEKHPEVEEKTPEWFFMHLPRLQKPIFPVSQKGWGGLQKASGAPYVR